MHTNTREEVYTTVYNYLQNLYERMYFQFKPVLSLQDNAIISFNCYQEMIQMAQKGIIDEFYERIRKDAI